MHRKEIIYLIGTLLSIFLICCIQTDHIAWFDTSIYDFLIVLKSESMTNLFLGISSITLPFIVISLFFWIFYPNKIISFFVSFHLTFSFILSNLLKLIFKRNRPIGIALTYEPGYSMPSSHAMVSIVFIGFLIYLVMIKVKNPYMRNGISILLALLILCVGVSRIYLGVHYASDVFLGFLFGILYLYFFLHLKKVQILFQKENKGLKGE